MAFQKGHVPPKKAKKGDKPAKPKAPKPPPLTKKQKAKLVTFKAPSDFKPAFYEVKMVIQHDGLISPGVRIERIKGAWDNVDAKRFNLAEYDTATLVGIVSRLQAASYSSNFHKRFPPDAKLGVFIRASAKKETGVLSVSIKAAYEFKEVKGKMKKVWFEDKADPTYKKIRRAARLLRGAFVSNQLPPSTGRRKKEDVTGDDE